MKRVLFHSLTIPPDNVSTGMLVAELAAGFNKNNIEVEILASTPQYNFENSKPNKLSTIDKQYSVSEYKGIKIFHVNSKKRSFKESRRIFQWMRFHYYSLLFLYKARKNYEHIFIFSYPPTMNIVSIFVYKILKLKVTYSVWELYPEIANNLNLFQSKLLTKMFKKLDTYSMKNTDNLVVNSPELRNYLIENRDLSKKNIEVITHFSPYPLSDNYPNLDLKKMFYAGNLGKPQNLEKFIQMSIEHDVKWKFDIYGAGTEYKNIQKYVNDDIALNKHIERNELLEKISDIPVALISLDKRITIEGFPGKTFDYLSMNKVLLSISNKESAVGKFIEKHRLGVNIEPDSVESFLDAFEKLSSRQFLSDTLLNVSSINKSQIKKSEIVKQYLNLV
ncbi:MAG: hypothetical protein CMQ89_01570 [Gammaproteobacteria bacterium]|nr:hypothetical protein [Gammaproteobacteria bacterium]